MIGILPPLALAAFDLHRKPSGTLVQYQVELQCPPPLLSLSL